LLEPPSDPEDFDVVEDFSPVADFDAPSDSFLEPEPPPLLRLSVA
jgi:hypothetical protein